MSSAKDKFGPEYVIKIYDPKIGMEGFLVIDNLALGPGKGGIRMTPDSQQGRSFSSCPDDDLENALMEIPFGGAKAGIVWNGGPDMLKKQFVQSFALSIKPFTPKRYIAGPDVSTGEKKCDGLWKQPAICERPRASRQIFALGRSGKTEEKCGIPHEFGSTGFGVAHAALVAAELKGINIKNATVAIDGFGNVGSFALEFLQKFGANVVLWPIAEVRLFQNKDSAKQRF